LARPNAARKRTAMDRLFCKQASGFRRPLVFLLTSAPVLVFLLSLGSANELFAQAAYGQVHIVPATPLMRHPDEQTVVKTNVDLALVNVTVTDPDGRIVHDLAAQDFSVLDDKRPRRIKYFSCEDAPISLAIVLDASSSMETSFDEVRKAAVEFFRASNPQDEFALISFADQPRVIAGFTDVSAELDPLLWPLRPGGHTALWDALYLGLRQMRSARYPTKALLVISDGGDNHSRFTESEIKSVVKEADVQVYAIDLFKAYPKTTEEQSGLLWLDEVTTASGGRAFMVHNPDELHRAVAQISLELRNQYVLGYSLPHTDRDGKWHKIKVEVNPSKKGRFRVYAKKGYYGPGE
jgi:Ca-activated chloride channel family protein